MMPVALMIGLAAALLLLIGGYLFGVRKGGDARESLREDNSRLARDIEALKRDAAQTETERDEMLRATVERALGPLVQRERLAIELSELKAGTGKRSDLTTLLDRIAIAGGFLAVVLGDADGLALAASSGSRDADRIAANSSLLLLTMDRMAGQAFPRSLSIVIRDEAETLLCRVFKVQDQRVTLTAVATGEARITPSTLDPALVKVSGALAGPF